MASANQEGQSGRSCERLTAGAGPFCATNFTLQADESTGAGKCICDPASAGPNCDFCEVPGRCAACGGFSRQQDGVCGALHINMLSDVAQPRPVIACSSASKSWTCA